MSGVVKTVKKAFKKNPILTTIVIAAAVWFTAGVAMAYMAAPSAGMGGAMSASATSMWTTATTGTFVSASEVAVTNATAAANGVTVGALAGEAATTGTAISATEGAGALSGAEAGIATSEAALTEASVAGTMPASAAGTATTAGSTTGGGIIQGAGGWMQANPIPTMVLGQAGVGELTIRDHNPAVIEGVDNGVQDGDFPDGAEVALGINRVTNLERFEDQDQHASGKVGEAALKRKTDGQAGSTDNGNEGGGSNADHGGDRDQQQNLEDCSDQAAEKLVQGGVFFAQLVIEDTDKPVDQPHAHNQSDNRQHDLGCVCHDQRHGLIHEFRGTTFRAK